MDHSIEIKSELYTNSGIEPHTRKWITIGDKGWDLKELASDASTYLLGKRLDMVEVFVDDERFELTSQDIYKIQNSMHKALLHNERSIDFEIDDKLFEF